MAAFEVSDLPAPWKVYKPLVSAHVNPRAWWRYSILTEIYKVRCLQKEDAWRVAGDRNMHLLSHIRVIIANNGGNLDGLDLSEASENYLTETTSKLRALEAAVDILNRENMTLRKMVKDLLTPLAKESLIGDTEALQYIEDQIATYELHAATTKLLQTSNEHELESSDALAPMSLDVETDEYVESEDEQLVAAIDAQDNKIRSPYENLLPPIALTERDMREPSTGGTESAAKSKHSAPNSGRGKSAKKTEKFPSYLEREAMRKEQARKKREQIILQSAELLVQASIAAEQNAQNQPAAAPGALPAISPRSVGGPTADHQHSLDGGFSVSSKSGKSPKEKSVKAVQQPAWVDDVRVPDILKGRGKGKARESSDEVESSSTKKIGRSAKLRASAGSAKEGEDGEDSVAASPISPSQRSMSADAKIGSTKDLADGKSRPSAIESGRSSKEVFPRPSADMTESEKLTVGIISKAREKVLKPEETKKPLSNIEKTLLKSPLALPLVKPLPAEGGAVATAQAQERAQRSKASPRGGGGGKDGSGGAQTAQSKKHISPRAAQTAESPRGAGKPSTKSSRTGAASTTASTPSSKSTTASSQSAPPTVSTAHPLTSSSPQESTLQKAVESPVKDAVSEKLKKRSVLKGLNERSNPSSPRKEDTPADATAETPTAALLAAAKKLHMEEPDESAVTAGDGDAGVALHALGLDASAPTDLAAGEDDMTHTTPEVAVEAEDGTVEWSEQGGAAPPSAEEIIGEVLRAAVQAAVDSLSRLPSRS